MSRILFVIYGVAVTLICQCLAEEDTPSSSSSEGENDNRFFRPYWFGSSNDFMHYSPEGMQNQWNHHNRPKLPNRPRPPTNYQLGKSRPTPGSFVASQNMDPGTVQFPENFENSQESTTSKFANIESGTSSCERDCTKTRRFSPVCGTDQKTYVNDEHLNCARYCGKNVSLAYNGNCRKRAPTPTGMFISPGRTGEIRDAE